MAYPHTSGRDANPPRRSAESPSPQGWRQVPLAGVRRGAWHLDPLPFTGHHRGRPALVFFAPTRHEAQGRPGKEQQGGPSELPNPFTIVPARALHKVWKPRRWPSASTRPESTNTSTSPLNEPRWDVPHPGGASRSRVDGPNPSRLRIQVAGRPSSPWMVIGLDGNPRGSGTVTGWKRRSATPGSSTNRLVAA